MHATYTTQVHLWDINVGIYGMHTNFQGMQFSQTIEIQIFIFEDLLSTIELHMHCDRFKKNQGFNFCG